MLRNKNGENVINCGIYGSGINGGNDTGWSGCQDGVRAKSTDWIQTHFTNYELHLFCFAC